MKFRVLYPVLGLGIAASPLLGATPEKIERSNDLLTGGIYATFQTMTADAGFIKVDIREPGNTDEIDLREAPTGLTRVFY